MKLAEWLFIVGYGLITVAFTICGFALVGFGLFEIWQALSPGETESPTAQLNAILRSIGLLTVAVASLELGQTVLEEEIRRKVDMSTPTRVRRFLSRFMIVIVVSLAIEFLVVVFEVAHDDPGRLPGAAAIGIATAALLVGWGAFIWFNKQAEELEPEAMQRTKHEDHKIDHKIKKPAEAP